MKLFGKKRDRLLEAAEGGQLNKVSEYLQKGSDVNARDESSRTPLHSAAVTGLREMAELLAAHHADVNAKDDKGDTPLHSAALWGQEGVVEVLMAMGAEVNARDGIGHTPLFWASYRGHRDEAQLLKRNGAVGGEKMLDGVLIIFTKDFEPKGTFINSILTKMMVHGRTYKEWMSEETPVRVLISPDARVPTTFAAMAAVQFRMLGIAFSIDNLEHATFEGSFGISGTIVTHWCPFA